jgi:hypothetical protein
MKHIYVDCKLGFTIYILLDPGANMPINSEDPVECSGIPMVVQDTPLKINNLVG